MYCIQDGRVCLQVWDPHREQWEYIPLTKWERMSARERSRYIIDK